MQMADTYSTREIIALLGIPRAPHGGHALHAVVQPPPELARVGHGIAHMARDVPHGLGHATRARCHAGKDALRAPARLRHGIQLARGAPGIAGQSPDVLATGGAVNGRTRVFCVLAQIVQGASRRLAHIVLEREFRLDVHVAHGRVFQRFQFWRRLLAPVVLRGEG